MTLDNVSAPTLVQVQIKASKTDPFRKGVVVYLGRTDNDLCPVGAVAAYLAVRGKMQTRGHASKIDSPPHIGYDVGDYASSYLPANTGSRCGLGCILAREHGMAYIL